MRIVISIVLVTLVSHMLVTVLNVIYYLIFPVVTFLICSVIYANGKQSQIRKRFHQSHYFVFRLTDGWSSNAGFEDSFRELRRLANSFWDGCRQLYEEARDLIV
jgi:hypothetical protein